jgi:hypothetical protein
LVDASSFHRLKNEGKGHHKNNGFQKFHQQSGIFQSKQIVQSTMQFPSHGLREKLKSIKLIPRSNYNKWPRSLGS